MEISKVKGQFDPEKDCAYNESRQCFLGLQVVSGDFTPASFQDWLSALKPNSGAGIWMNPFRGIPAPDVRVPMDLLYLDENCRVIETVEFFPTFQVSPSCPPAASVLALPSHSIFSSQTQAGDQLILSRSDEVEWRLEALKKTGTVSPAVRPPTPRPVLGPVLVRDTAKEAKSSILVDDYLLPHQPAPSQPDKIEASPAPQPEERVLAEPVIADPVIAEPAIAEPVLPQPASQPASQPQTPPATPDKPHKPQTAPWTAPSRMPAASGLGKLSRWLFSNPADPRVALRRPVSGLVAHFFTGGAPIAHEIRDVSFTGLFVVTTERWYPGTIIRMTLTKPDIGQAPDDRSVTIQAKAVRWGNDGVGLQFLVEARRKGKRGPRSPLDPVDGEELQSFLLGPTTEKR